MKLFSIIIPHYNEWNMLSHLLNTIPKREELEIIVIDDHSNQYEKNIEKLIKVFPHVIFTKNNIGKKGAGAARNKGLTIANGKWLLFADSDDLFLSNFFKKITHYIDSNVDIIYFTPTSFFEDTAEKSSRHIPYERYIFNYLNESKLFDELKLRYYFEPPWSKLIRHDLIKSNNIKFEEIMYSNDILFSAKVGFYSKKIEASKETIYAVRQRKGSLTSFVSETTFRLRFNAWLNYVVFLKTNLSKQEQQLLNISAFQYFLRIFNNKLGIKNIFYVIKRCRIANIPLLDKRILNPLFVIKALKNTLKESKGLKKTEVRE